MVTIKVSFAEGEARPSEQEQADIKRATTAWECTLKDDVGINVQFWKVDMSATGAGLNALCIPGIVQESGETLTRPQAKLKGVSLPNPDDLDLVVAFDAKTPWLHGEVRPEAGAFSLSTTMLHELCHGLGFSGLCGIDASAELGIYSDVSLIERLQLVTGAMRPKVDIPVYFFPDTLQSGQMTPFAALFSYADGALTKGKPGDDFIAFTTKPKSITVPAASATYVVTTADGAGAFKPFTTCDHIQSPHGGHYLMSPSTAGLYLAAPDAPACELMQAIGWTL